MKNKIKRITSIVLCMVLCLSVFAVSNPNNEGESEKDAPISISFVGYEGMIQARAGEPTPYTGSSLWVSVASTDNSDNKKYNCSDAEWKATNGVFAPTSTVYYTGTSGDQTLWAFSSDVTEWSLPESYEDGLSDSDLLYAKTTLTSATVQNLEMQHLLSKITVKISGFGNELSSPSVDEVALTDLLSKVAIDRTEVDAPIMAATDATTDAETVMYGSDGTFEALVCPSTQTTVGIGVAVTVDGVDKYFTTTASFADGLKSGYHYIVNLQVANDKITIGTVTVMDWNDGGTIDAPTATEPEASYSISGTTATITVPEYASAASVQAAITAVAADASVTTITVNGTLSDAQQTTLATALEGNTTLKIVFEDMNLADLSDDVKWMGNPIDTADGAILQVASCGENAQYMIYHTGDANSRTLSIKGTGAMANYDGNSYAPWFDQESYQIPDNITKVEIAEGITTIGDNTFGDGYGIASVTLPVSITSIGWRGFASSLSLTSITIPKDVTSISSYAFGACRSLESVTVLATTPPTLGTNVFNNCSESLIIYVPSESVAEYRSKWSDYADKIQPIQ